MDSHSSVRAVAVGLLGSMTVAVGSLATGRLAPTPGVRGLIALQHAPHVRSAGQLLIVAGLVALTLGWALLGWMVRRGACSSKRVVAAGLVWAAPLVVVPPAFSGDAWSYVANGMIAARGYSPYQVTPAWLSGPVVEAVSAKWRHAPAPYGAIPLLWGEVTTRLTPSLWLGLLSFRVLALVGLALLAWSVSRLARLTGQDPAMALWLAVASPFTLVHGIAGAHVDLLMAGLATAAVLMALRRRWALATLLLGAAMAVKAPALLDVVPVALAIVLATGGGRWARMGVAALVSAGALATGLALGLVSGLGNGWVADLRSPLTVRSPLSLTTQVGLHVSRLVGAPDLALVQGLGSVLIAGCALWFLLRPRDLSPATVVAAGAYTTGVAVLLSPVVHFWYFFWCLPLLAAVPLGRGLRRTVIATTVAFGLLAPLDASQHLPDAHSWQMIGVALALLAGLDPRHPGRKSRAEKTDWPGTSAL